MDFSDYKIHLLLRLETIMAQSDITPAQLATLLNRSESNVKNIFKRSKCYSEEFIYNSALAIGVHPDVIFAFSKPCISVFSIIPPHEIPPFNPPPYRTRKKK